MRPWKAVLGVGGACAACCAIPLAGGVAALTAGTAALVAMGSALLACADEYATIAIGLLALAVLGGAVTWRARSVRRNGSTGQGEVVVPAQCRLGPVLPPTVQPSPRKACGCTPGTCG